MHAGYERPHRAVRAAVVDEHVLLRTRAVHLLDSRPDIEVVHASSSVARLLGWLRNEEQRRWPHLLVLDVTPGARSQVDLDAVVALHTAGVRVVVLSGLTPPRLARRIANAGVDGIVSKRDSEETFLDVVNVVLGSGSKITDEAASVIAGGLPSPDLSEQEARVLEKYASGMTIGSVADEIGVRHDTARKYLSRIKRKYASLGRSAHSKLDLALLAAQDGYIDPTAAERGNPA